MKNQRPKRVAYPSYLENYGSLLSHLENQFNTLLPHEKSEEKGDRFVEFALRIVPHLDLGQRFDRPKKNKRKTHDKGVDLSCHSLDNSEELLIQSKYSIPEVKEFDSVISKFQNYDAERRRASAGGNLFEALQEDSLPTAHFMIITVTDLRAIRQRYERSQMSSKPFYDTMMQAGRLHVIDGPTLLPVLQTAYRKQHILPTGVILNLVQPYIFLPPVYVGIISGSELKQIYRNFGNALFLENIREFLGQASGRVSLSQGQITVNKEIAKTLQEEPAKFLERNNGITFRAATVTRIDENTLRLDEASIVNGCQTTMSIVQHPHEGSHVLVKIVETTNSWDVAEAANFQNEIKQLDLRLARYIRPQEIRNVASKSDVAFKSASEEASAFAMLDSFYQKEITYEEVRALFIGLFSNTPNNAIDNNYTKLKNHIVRQVFEDTDDKEKTFDILFKIHRITQESAKVIQSLHSDSEDVDLFQRFWKEDKPNYRVFLAILAACGCVHKNIYDDNANVTYQVMMDFLEEIHSTIDNYPELFTRYYRDAFLVVSFDVEKPGVAPDKIVHTMYKSIEQSDFRNLYSRLKRMAKNDDRLMELEEARKNNS
ncbi:MAG TPA: AIPR family protein [Pyrinomonadaceae bacterium]|jgi:hypothetical protein